MQFHPQAFPTFFSPDYQWIERTFINLDKFRAKKHKFQSCDFDLASVCEATRTKVKKILLYGDIKLVLPRKEGFNI